MDLSVTPTILKEVARSLNAGLNGNSGKSRIAEQVRSASSYSGSDGQVILQYYTDHLHGDMSLHPAAGQPVYDKIYLHVPVKERREAQNRGALWDKKRKQCFIYENEDIVPFANWLNLNGM